MSATAWHPELLPPATVVQIEQDHDRQTLEDYLAVECEKVELATAHLKVMLGVSQQLVALLEKVAALEGQQAQLVDLLTTKPRKVA
jgi:hypothetical protein